MYRISVIKKPLQRKYEQFIANSEALRAFVIEPTAERTMALAVAGANEYIRSADTTNKYFKFVPNTRPAGLDERSVHTLLTSTSRHFQAAMAGLRSTEDINRIYQNALDKLSADLAFSLRVSDRIRQQEFHWAVFVNTLNEYGKEAFAGKLPSKP